MPVWLETSITVITGLTMFVGLVGLIVPIFPGNVVIWVAALIYGISTGFETLGWWMFGLITLLMLAAVSADNILMGAKARASGASWLSIILALLSGVIGTIVFPPIGGLVAAPLILFAAEYVRLRDHTKALQTIRGLLIGWGLAFVVRFALGVFMIGFWAIWAFA